MEEIKNLYCFMNKKIEFIGERDEIVNKLSEAIGFPELIAAKAYKEDLDEPDEWKIVKKKIIFKLEEIVEEN